MRSLVLRRFCAASALVALTAAPILAQGGGGPAGYGPTPGPAAFPASPLAGGPAAAAGGAYTDVYGNPIVLPASYCGPAGDPYGACPAGYPGGGDGMYADFGGYSMPDQVGPHYFDVSVETVFLQNDDSFEGVAPLASIGAAGPTALAPSGLTDDYEAGWRIALRYDLGPLSVLEATYMGLYDIGFGASLNSVDVAPGNQDFQLFSPFSQYGVGTLIPGVDDGQTYSINYQADLQSTEFSYRRYWVGANPRVSGTYLLGFRYLRLTEDFTFNTVGLVTPVATGEASRLWSSENDLLGFQLGGDGWIGLRQGLRLGSEVKAGVYNNRFVFQNAGDLPGQQSDFNSVTKGNQVAFASEANVVMVADILPSWSIRGGYQVLYLNSLATVGNNIDPTNYFSTAANTQAHALYHGFFGGLEYIW
ncbi:MAG: hypothetical protein KF847_14815 [Pirellulales bacterium]|nr:hypothetical protein [Pirellulales bacterium]